MSDPEHHLARTYDELRLFRSAADADRALRAWQRELCRTPVFWLSLLVLTAMVALVAFTVLPVLRFWIPIPSTPFGRGTFVAIVGPAIGLTIWLATTRLYRHHLRRFLRRQLRMQGIPVCLRCG